MNNMNRAKAVKRVDALRQLMTISTCANVAFARYPLADIAWMGAVGIRNLAPPPPLGQSERMVRGESRVRGTTGPRSAGRSVDPGCSGAPGDLGAWFSPRPWRSPT